MKVHRCFFRDFFARHDAELLTTIMCAFDVTFMTSIDPAVSGLRAERTSLLSLGDDECRFAVTVMETDDPLAEYTGKLEQRFADGEGSGEAPSRRRGDRSAAGRWSPGGRSSPPGARSRRPPSRRG